MTHNISVNAYRLSPERFEAGTSGSYGFERMALTFSEEWQGLSKTVTFFPPKSRPVTKVLTDGDAFDIPPEATAKSGEILFTVFGYRDGKRIYAHSGEMLVRSVKKGEGLPSEAPTPSEKEQILAFVTAIKEMIEAGKIKGDSPYVGENGNWFVGDTDTGVSATKLPHVLTFTGAASGVYDGSEPVEVEIPEEGNKVFFQEEEPEDAETGDFWYVEEEESGGLLVVTVDANNKASHTAAEINTFVQSGGSAVLVWFSNVFHAKIITASKCQFGTMFNATTGATEWIMDVDASGKATFSNVVLASLKNPNAITLTGAVEATYDGSKPVEVEIPTPQSVDIPEALPNPNAITFTGAVEATYDGSQPVVVEIPTPTSVEIPEKLPNPNAITFTGAVSATYDGSSAVAVEIPDTAIPRIEMASTDTTAIIEPNTLYVFPEMASLEITIGGTVDTSIVQEYRFRFTSGATATTLTLPSNVVGEISVDANKVYEVSILDGYLVSQSWEVS